MTYNTFMVLMITFGMVAMWIAPRDGKDESLYSFMLFFFGPFSLAFVLLTHEETETTNRGSVGALGIILSGLYGLMVLQWMTGKSELW